MSAIEGSCHCGAVRIRVDEAPTQLTACNCSICRRLGTIWGHGEAGDIEIKAAPGATLSYVWGDKGLAFHSCNTCGCTTHWQSLSAECPDRLAVNLRLAPPGTIEAIGLRHFDGADSWTFLD